MLNKLTIIGGGLAGSEAAWQAAKRGVEVTLYEMRPGKTTPAHRSGDFGELVCSNSLGAASPQNASGILKEEMRRLDSLIMKAADENSLPAGGALAVDRDGFAAYITKAIEALSNVKIIREEVTHIPYDVPLLIASGPLTSDALALALAPLIGDECLYFYDAIAPVVSAESIDYESAFRASRYDKGGDDYLNCPMTKEEYELFWQEIVAATQHQGKDFEKLRFFEGCMPIEELARRGFKTPLFGPMKPVGLTDPKSGKRPYAVVQLRQENKEGTMYNLVGFQTSLKWGEQKRIFSLIPALANAEFLRYGSMHRNTFIKAPEILTERLTHKNYPQIWFAGQLTGVEGYVESTAMGLLAGIYASHKILEKDIPPIPRATAIGSLINYLTTAEAKHFQPMNINLGLFPALAEKIRDKKERADIFCKQALDELAGWAVYL